MEALEPRPQLGRDRRLRTLPEQIIPNRTPSRPFGKRFPCPNTGVELADTTPPVTQLETEQRALRAARR